MFESAELGNEVDKETYEKEVPKLRAALLAAQGRVKELSRFPVIVVIGGVDAAGKGETVNLLNEWMDPRHIHNHAYGARTDDEKARPAMWRFWRDLPPRGEMGISFGAWYDYPLMHRLAGKMSDDEHERHLADIVAFEKMLGDEGALVAKYWFHLSKKRQRKRLDELAAHKKTRWRVSDAEWQHHAQYDEFREIAEKTLRETSRNRAMWTVVEGSDARWRSLTVGRSLLAAMTAQLEQHEEHAAKKKAKKTDDAAGSTPLAARDRDAQTLVSSIDLSLKLDKKEYEDELEKAERRLNLLFRAKKLNRRHSVMAVFEGSDAAGKGGAIRRVTHALDARQYQVVPIAAPTEEERAQPYLWRFWRRVPARGRMTIFDRSWYGRVLVERVEGYCTPADWTRAYSEINDFEEQLARHGSIVVKLWLQISPEEQLKRFREREDIAFKRYKITPDDWRNRKKWDAYEEAMSDMVDRTSTEIAPWKLVAAEDKHWARIQVLTTICDRIEAAL
jgi:polyphosphate:AMP phosphotransferase